MIQSKNREDLLSYITDDRPMTLRQQLLLIGTLSLPGIITQLAIIVMQYIDAAMVGRLGADSAAAIGLVSSSTWLLGGVCSAGVLGFTVQAAQYIGAKQYESAGNCLRSGMFSIILFTLALAMVGMGVSGMLPSLLGGHAELHQNATDFFRIYAASMPFVGMNFLASGMLQCSGNMKTPSIMNIMMCVLDVVFNLFLIFPQWEMNLMGFHMIFPGYNLGVMGAALGTASAEAVTALTLLYFVFFRTPKYARCHKLSFDEFGNYVKKALRIGSPAAFESIVMHGAMMVSTRIVAPLGSVALSAHSFAITAESLCYMPGYGIGKAATVLVGQSAGAGRAKLTKYLARETMWFGVAVMSMTGALMFFAAPLMMGILTPDPEIQHLGTLVLRIEAFAEPFYAASIVAAGGIQGGGNTLLPSLMNFFSMWVVRIPLSWICASHWGLVGVWIAMALELCFRGLTLAIVLYRGKWIRRIVN